MMEPEDFALGVGIAIFILGIITTILAATGGWR